MIVNKEKMDPEQFKKVFAKKFKNFCSKLPIMVSYKLLPNGVVLYEHYDEGEDNKSKIVYYEYDYSTTVQKNIYGIKKILYKYFPSMNEIIQEEIDATTEETNQKVYEGVITLQDVTPNGYLRKYKKEWQIEKVIIDRDELFIRDLGTKELRRYRMKYPVVTFLKRLRKGEWGKNEAWKFFISKSENKPLDPFDEGEETNDKD